MRRMTAWVRAHRVTALLLLVGAALLAGYLAGSLGTRSGPETDLPEGSPGMGGGGSAHAHEHAGAASGADDDHAEPHADEIWTCSMHPQIRQSQPGACPLCGMDLIPVAGPAEGATHRAGTLTLSPEARQRAAVAIAPVERRPVATEIRMFGTIAFDESRLSDVTAWVPGRIERLYADFTGMAVRAGDHLVSLYSPDLISAQAELLAARASRGSGAPLATGGSGADPTLAAARERLRSLGLTPEQIATLERTGRPSEEITLFAPTSGIIVHKDAVAGMVVATGTRLYTIADLSQLWVQLAAYETDLAWIRYGQEVSFETEAYPGERFTGLITFVDPVLDARTRTAKVRVQVANPEGRLLPGMFVRATLHSHVVSGGRVIDPRLAGRWICPMHPDVIASKPGTCPRCAMPLVTSESLGYAAPDSSLEPPPLVIPATAPLITGKRAVVYVEAPDQPGVYTGREVLLGPRAGEFYVVRDGLQEGERVVVQGAFKIDSAVQILAGPSMMSPRPDPQRSPPAPALQEHLDELLTAYFLVQQALSRDDLHAAHDGAAALHGALGAPLSRTLDPEVATPWQVERAALEQSARELATAADLAAARRIFLPLSNRLTHAVTRFGTAGAHLVLQFHCPMAFDGRGGDWLQDHDGTENPYYGSVMFRCGSRTATLSDAQAASPRAEQRR